MRELVLDAGACHTRAQLHEALAQLLGFAPEYSGTLDELYDRLCGCPATQLTLCNVDLLVDTLGNYGELVLRVIAGAAMENTDFVLYFE